MEPTTLMRASRWWVPSGIFRLVWAVFTLIGGYIGDRMPIRMVIFGFSLLQAVAVIILLLADSVAAAFLFAVVLGIGYGGRNPLTAAIRGVYFGRRAYASITGISMVPMNFLMFVMPLFAGYMFDITGNYTVPFIIVAMISIIGSCLFFPLGDPPALPSSRRIVGASRA